MGKSFEESFPALLGAADKVAVVFTGIAVVVLFVALLKGASEGIEGNLRSAMHSIARVAIIVVCIVNFADWADQIQLGIHSVVSGSLDLDPSKSHQRFLTLLEQKDENASWIQILTTKGAGINTLVYLFVYLFSIVTFFLVWLITLLQHVMAILGVSVSPLCLSLLTLQTTRGVATRFLLSYLAVLLWPLGWALAHTVSGSILDSVAANPARGIGLVPFVHRNLGYVLAAGLWMLLSTLFMPRIISSFINSGAMIGISMINAVAESFSRGTSGAVTGGVTAAMAGADRTAMVQSATAAGMAGGVSGALGGSGALVASAVAIGGAIGVQASQTSHNPGSGNAYSEANRVLDKDRR